MTTVRATNTGCGLFGRPSTARHRRLSRSTAAARLRAFDHESLLLPVAADVPGVDPASLVLHGAAIAQLGQFKSDGRGQFDMASLRSIVTLMNANRAGVRCRFGHPAGVFDAIGSFVGRWHNARLAGRRVVGDLHLDAAARLSPRGNLVDYILAQAASDPAALSSSLVLRVERVPVDDGPPIWRPMTITASDLVDEGDAVDGLMPGLSRTKHNAVGRGEGNCRVTTRGLY